jgi:integrase
VMMWYAARSDFRPVITRGMARTKPTQRRRKRILSDAELQAVWQAAETAPSAFSRFVQFVLLTAVRRAEAAKAPRSELSADGHRWLIPADRYKTDRDHFIPLSSAARAILAKTPMIGRLWIFTTNGKKPLGGFSKFKKEFDKLVFEIMLKADPEAALPRWTLHDLRRTARSLMSRAGVEWDIGERCLGHVPDGMRETYDRYEYLDEKRQAFESLGRLVGQIVESTDAAKKAA